LIDSSHDDNLFDMKGFKYKGILVFAFVFVLVIGLQELGILPDLSMPTGNEWFFHVFGILMPTFVAVFAWWKRVTLVGISTTIIFSAYLLKLLYALGLTSGSWVIQYAFPLLLAVGLIILLYYSYQIQIHKNLVPWTYVCWVVLVVPALYLPQTITFYPYHLAMWAPTLVAIPALIILSFNGRGGLAAVSVVVFSVFFPLSVYIGFVSQILEVLGFLLLGFHLAGIHWANRESEDPPQKEQIL